MNGFERRPPGGDADLESIARLIQRVFDDDATTEAHRTLVAAGTFVPESLPTVWDAGGNAVSVVQAVPCDIALLGTWVPGGIITMVATDPEHRGRGHMRACMEAAHDWLQTTGRPLAILYGVPAIYPKFGYRPVMPRVEVRYTPPNSATDGSTRLATAEDLRAIANLFNEQERSRSCSVRRPAEAWVWSSRFARSALRMLQTNDGIDGYLRYNTPDEQSVDLEILEAACESGSETQMVEAIHSLAAELGIDQIILRLMPDHPVAREVASRAVSLEINDVRITETPPQAGMIAVLDPDLLMGMLRPVIEERLNSQALSISTGDGFQFGTGPGFYLPHEADLAHLLSGYPGVSALHQWGRLQADDNVIALAETIFPRGWPRWTTEPYWGE